MGNNNQRQDVFFDAGMMPEQNWGYVVEYRIVLDDEAKRWSDWQKSPYGVCHFRSELGADEYQTELCAKFSRPISLGLMELRTVPKYLGGIPDKDEAWIKP